MPDSYIQDYPAELRAKVYSWFRQNPRISALIEAIGTTAQAVEDEMFDVLVSSYIDTATGLSLDNIGSWYGARRGSLNDSEYRRLLRVTRRAQRSNGELPVLLDIVATAMDDPEPEAFPAYPAAFRISFTATASAALLSRLKPLVEDATKLGVGVQLLYSEGSPFTFDVDGLGLDDGYLLEIL